MTLIRALRAFSLHARFVLRRPLTTIELTNFYSWILKLFTGSLRITFAMETAT